MADEDPADPDSVTMMLFGTKRPTVGVQWKR